MIHTDYFAHAHSGTVIDITLFSPEWVVAPKYKQLAPSKSLLQKFKGGRVTEEEYYKEFMGYLLTLNPVKVLSKLESYGKNPIMCCYCKGFCHRHIVAEWLTTATGEVITERKCGGQTRRIGRIINPFFSY